MTETGKPVTPATSDDKLKTPHYTVVPLPKIVFFYPLMIVCFICGGIQMFSGSGDGTFTPNNVAGTLFVALFLINTIVISFDFPGVKAIALFALIVAVMFALLYLNAKFNIFGPLKVVFKTVTEQLGATSVLYLMIGGILLVMIVSGILVNVLWNRWTIEPNRLIHKHGILGNIKEYPVIDLQMEKSIDDVFEYALLFSGTLIFRPNPNTPPIRLENIPLINRAERKIQAIIRQFKVST